jgi:hypothetical protein
MKNEFDFQGKSKSSIEASELIAFIAWVGLGVTIIISLIIF